MLKSLKGKMLQQFDKDPAVYEVAKHDLRRSQSLPCQGQATQHPIAEITNHLYLCGAKAVTASALISLGITHVVNCTLDIPHTNVKGVKTTRIGLEDRPRSNLGRFFGKVSEKVRKEYGRGGKTLIHCYAGVSRSATLCMAYLMKYYRQTLKHAFFHVRLNRPQVNPNNGFWEQLIQYERKLFGFNSVAMLKTPRGVIPDVYLQPRTPNNVNIQHCVTSPGGLRKTSSGVTNKAMMVTLV